jgi:CAAX prenyl protease-like protein
MRLLDHARRHPPAVLRVAPFIVFLVLTWCQGQFGEAGRYWFYVAKSVVGAWMIWEIRPWVAELRWAWSWPAAAAGVAVFILWVGLDGLYPGLNDIFTYIGLEKPAVKDGPATSPWNPHQQFGHNSPLAWVMIGTRLVGSTLVVPPLEEVFYRSFVYRSLVRSDFEKVPLGAVRPIPIALTALIFAVNHQEWLAALLCGLIYQGLVCWKKRLGDAITAHAITNLLLGVWVVWRGAWNFW